MSDDRPCQCACCAEPYSEEELTALLGPLEEVEEDITF